MITIQLLLNVPETELALLLKEWNIRLDKNMTKIDLIESILVNAPANRGTSKYAQVKKLIDKHNS